MRLWVWTGILLPNQMVRLTHARGRWMGELWRFWPADNQTFTDVMEHCGCTRMIRGGDYTACRVLEERGIDWEAFARGLQELRALSPVPEPPPSGTAATPSTSRSGWAPPTAARTAKAARSSG